MNCIVPVSKISKTTARPSTSICFLTLNKDVRKTKTSKNDWTAVPIRIFYSTKKQRLINYDIKIKGQKTSAKQDVKLRTNRRIIFKNEHLLCELNS